MYEVNTSGTILKYAVEQTSGTRPTSGYTVIPNIKSIPDFNPEPSQLDCTDLAETEYKRYIPGLKDIGGSIAFRANNTNQFQAQWAALVAAFEEGKADDKATWFEIYVGGLDKSFYFAGYPTNLGLSAVEVDTVLEVDAYITPNKVEGWGTKSS